VLEVEPGAPLLMASARTFEESGKPIELSISIFRGDRYRFRTTLLRAGATTRADHQPKTKNREDIMEDRKDRKGKLLLGRPFTRRRILQGSLMSGAAVAGASLLPVTPRQAQADTPKKGGNLRVAILGGSNADTLDAHSEVTQPDSARVMSLYEGLVRIDPAGKLINVLAESMEANATAMEWTIRLRKGVEFHNGKPLTAEDVAFTLRRIADPKAPMTGATALKQLDLAGIKILDDVTLKVPMKAPYAAFPEGISAVYFFGIVPTGYDPKKPVGTGPSNSRASPPARRASSAASTIIGRRASHISTSSPSSIPSRAIRRPSTRSRAGRWMSSPMHRCR
jgi:ABC-type dipeptide transport system, periplasmic component